MKHKQLFFYVIIFALVLRVFFMFSTFNTDMLYRSYYSSYLTEGVFDIYSYSYENNLCFIYTETGPICYVYPPLNYLMLGVSHTLTSPLAFGFDEWAQRFYDVSSPNVSEHIPWTYLPDSEHYTFLYIDGIDYLHWNLFLEKLLYFVFDVLVLVLLFKLFKGKHLVWSIFFWAFNPVLIYSSEIIGNYDIILVFFMLFAFFLLGKEKVGWAIVSVSIAASIKLFPLFFLPPLIIIYGRSLLQMVKLLIVALITLLIIALPFLGSPGFLLGTFQAASGSAYPKFLVDIVMQLTRLDLNTSIAPYLILIGFFYLMIFFKVPERKLIHYVNSTLIVALLFFSFRQFNLNYIMWAIPALFFTYPNHKRFAWVYIILATILSNVLSDQIELNIGLFAPIAKSFVLASKAPIAYLPQALGSFLIISTRLMLTLMGLYFIYVFACELYSKEHILQSLWKAHAKKKKV